MEVYHTPTTQHTTRYGTLTPHDAQEVFDITSMMRLNDLESRVSNVEGQLTQITLRLEQIEQRLDKLIFMIASFGIGMAGGMAVLIVRSFT